MSATSQDQRRRRRERQEARTEILDAAERFLWERPLSDLIIGELMRTTSIGRSAFYVHFRDQNDLLRGLLERLEAQLVDAAAPWIAEDADEEGVAAALDGVVAVWKEHGPVLRAIIEASFSDAQIRAAWHGGVLERFVSAVAERIKSARLGRGGDPRQLATALLLMNERYLMETLGRVPQGEPAAVSATLREVWTSALYGMQTS